MTPKVPFQLYSTDGCHLCEMAYALVVELGNTELVETVDIVDSDGLTEAYGIRIPVIKHMQSGQELGWPFDIEQLAAFFADNQH